MLFTCDLADPADCSKVCVTLRLERGLRFSTNAATPSAKSCVRAQRAKANSSSSICVSIDRVGRVAQQALGLAVGQGRSVARRSAMRCSLLPPARPAGTTQLTSPSAPCGGGVEQVGQQRQLHRFLVADQPRQEVRAAPVRAGADVGIGEREAGVVGCDRQIRGAQDAEAGAGAPRRARSRAPACPSAAVPGSPKCISLPQRTISSGSSARRRWNSAHVAAGDERLAPRRATRPPAQRSSFCTSSAAARNWIIMSPSMAFMTWGRLNVRVATPASTPEQTDWLMRSSSLAARCGLAQHRILQRRRLPVRRGIAPQVVREVVHHDAGAAQLVVAQPQLGFRRGDHSRAQRLVPTAPRQ